MDAPRRHGCPDAPGPRGRPYDPAGGTLGAMVGSALAVLRDAARLLLGQWPTLAVIALLGLIGHNGFLWFCVWLSERNGLATAILLPLVPISSLVALVLMLRHAGRHEPTLAGLVHDVPGSRLQARLTLLASTLIPFLTLYVAPGPARGGPQGLRQRGGGHRVPHGGLLEPRHRHRPRSPRHRWLPLRARRRRVRPAHGARPLRPAGAAPVVGHARRLRRGAVALPAREPGGQLRGPGARLGARAGG